MTNLQGTVLGLTSFCQQKKVENLEINFWQKEGRSKLAPLRMFFKCLNVPRCKSQSSASNMFLFFLKSKTNTFYRNERVSLNILKLSLCGLLPFVRKGQRHTLFWVFCCWLWTSYGRRCRRNICPEKTYLLFWYIFICLRYSWYLCCIYADLIKSCGQKFLKKF